MMQAAIPALDAYETSKRGFKSELKPVLPEMQVQEVRAYVAQLLAKPQFTLASRRGQLLEYLVQQTLAGEATKVTEYGIGLDVFRRPASFDPAIESLVRTEISRLRQRIRRYYEEEGRNDSIEIRFPPRSYALKFEFRDTATLPKSEAAPLLVVPRHETSQKISIRVTSLAVLLFAVIATVVCLSWLGHKRQLPLRRPLHAIVVLPFEDYSPHHEDEYIGDGMTEALTNDLAQLHDLRVVARTTAFSFKGKGEDVREIGRQLLVDAVLEGSITRDRGRMQITAQLSRSSDGFQLWSQSYLAGSKDMMATQEEVANAITAAISQMESSKDAAQIGAVSTKLEAGPKRITDL